MKGRSFVDAFARCAVEYAHAQELIDAQNDRGLLNQRLYNARLRTEIWYQRKRIVETIVAIVWTAVLVPFVLITFPFVVTAVACAPLAFLAGPYGMVPLNYVWNRFVHIGCDFLYWRQHQSQAGIFSVVWVVWDWIFYATIDPGLCAK